LPAAPSRAVLGFLDPITGEESFKDVEPVSLMPPPRFQTAERGKRCIAEMLGWLEKEGKERGAAHPPNLQMVEVDLGAPAFPWWIDGTYKYLKR
jgi:hypothetical protein